MGHYLLHTIQYHMNALHIDNCQWNFISVKPLQHTTIFLNYIESMFCLYTTLYYTYFHALSCWIVIFGTLVCLYYTALIHKVLHSGLFSTPNSEHFVKNCAHAGIGAIPFLATISDLILFPLLSDSEGLCWEGAGIEYCGNGRNLLNWENIPPAYA